MTGNPRADLLESSKPVMLTLPKLSEDESALRSVSV